LRIEQLEDRTVMSTTVLAPGYTLTTFATNPAGASEPDSIAVDRGNVWVGYGNGGNPDGSGGAVSTIVEYTSTGAIVQQFSVTGHNDGLKVDPRTHLVWALQNEDADPNLVVINPLTATQTQYGFAPVANGGGFDDITFLGNKVFLSESNPLKNPNTDPAIVEATLNDSTHMVDVKTVLMGNAMAFNLVTKQQVQLNLQDPDSMTADGNGDLFMTSQSDDEIVTVKHPSKPDQSVTVLPLTDASQAPVSVDDSLFPPDAVGSVLMTDQASGTIYRITGKAINNKLVLSAAPDIGELGSLNTHTGLFTPVINGLGSPKGLAFLPVEVAPGYSVKLFATSPAGTSQPDSIAVDGNSVFVGYGNGVAKDGSQNNLSSTIVEYTSTGAIVQEFSVPGHNDGLKVDPTTHLVWALQNEDGDPNLVVIDPAHHTQTQYNFGPVANGGGFDDITFVGGKVFLSESNPSNNPNTDPAIVEATLDNSTHMVNVTTVLLGNATAFNLITKQQVQLNLQDPDSMTADAKGNLVMTSQADDEIVTVHNPGTTQQFVTLLPLQLSVDDTLFLPQRRGWGDDSGSGGVVLVTDQASGAIYEISGPGLGSSSQPLTAALDVGEVGRLNMKTGAFTPIISGLANPRGLAFLGISGDGEGPDHGHHGDHDY
jgi:sugar lactone lactonase YvrE